jgi:hypothetical protein
VEDAPGGRDAGPGGDEVVQLREREPAELAAARERRLLRARIGGREDGDRPAPLQRRTRGEDARPGAGERRGRRDVLDGQLDAMEAQRRTRPVAPVHEDDRPAADLAPLDAQRGEPPDRAADLRRLSDPARRGERRLRLRRRALHDRELRSVEVHAGDEAAAEQRARREGHARAPDLERERGRAPPAVPRELEVVDRPRERPHVDLHARERRAGPGERLERPPRARRRPGIEREPRGHEDERQRGDGEDQAAHGVSDPTT